jgi:hypothetical protein
VIRNVCIHVSNEQPLLCDLYDMPSASDAGLVCTNVRSMDGKRPIFVDATASTFFFPYHVVRFLEIPEREMARYHTERPRRTPAVRVVAGDGEPMTDGGPGGYDPLDDVDGTLDGHGARPDEDPGSLLPVAVGAGDAGADPEDDGVLEIDESLLQRIRDL